MSSEFSVALLEPAYFTIGQCDDNYYRNYDNILCLYILLCYYYRCCSIIIIIIDSLGAAYICTSILKIMIRNSPRHQIQPY